MDFITVKENKTRFRIQIYDLKEKRSKTVGLVGEGKYSLEEIKQKIIDCLTKK